MEVYDVDWGAVMMVIRSFRFVSFRCVNRILYLTVSA